MSDICVAYWSGTGNTEAMAQAIGAGITAAGKSADVVPMETISPADLKDQAVWVLGCPAMGAEELEDGSREAEAGCQREKTGNAGCSESVLRLSEKNRRKRGAGAPA